MFKNTYQSGFISILYAGGAKPLSIWGQEVKNGHIRRVTDEDVQTLALEIMGTNVATTFIICPPRKNQTLGIRLPFFIMIVKNMKKYFTFEITILDDKNMSRRFRVSNYQSTTRVRPFSTCLPIGLTGGWNQIQFNLADFTRRAYGSSYLETLRVQIHANVRIRRIYFSDRLYAEDEMPQEFKLYVPISKQKDKGKAKVGKTATEDKSTGADKIRISIEEVKAEEKAAETEEEPSCAPPTPTDTQGATDEGEPAADEVSIPSAASDVAEKVEAFSVEGSVAGEAGEPPAAAEGSVEEAGSEKLSAVTEVTEETADKPSEGGEDAPTAETTEAPPGETTEAPPAEAEGAAPSEASEPSVVTEEPPVTEATE